MTPLPELERKPGEHIVPGLAPCGPCYRYVQKATRWCRDNDVDAVADCLGEWTKYLGLAIRRM
jgi:hypothetical protein